MNSPVTKKRVVITGLGVVCPTGNDATSVWGAAMEGVYGISKITRFPCEDYSTQVAGEVKNLDLNPYIEPKEQRRMDLFSQYALVAASQAWDDAKISEFDATKFGCIFGVGIGGLPILERYHEALLNGGPRKVSPFLIPAMISNLAPGNVAIKYGLKGVNYTVTSACTSSNHAIGEAYRMIANGLQERMLTGGTESAVTPLGIAGFCSMKAMSTRNDEPTRASRPFDKDRDGFVLSEGSAVIVLEELSVAQKRGAKIYAEIVGYGFSCDAFHITGQAEGGEGAVQSMTMALADAGLTADQIGYVNAHGTSTPLNDPTETLAIKKVMGANASSGLLVSSTKSMTGHLLGAAGAVEAFFTAMALKTGMIPPTINLDNPDSACDLDYVPHKPRAKQVEYALSNSFGFGGTNATVAFKRWV
jgi:3-oxoacyl-[acyl-carrier-protein] synthase II